MKLEAQIDKHHQDLPHSLYRHALLFFGHASFVDHRLILGNIDTDPASIERFPQPFTETGYR
jgi:hypothetical protein